MATERHDGMRIGIDLGGTKIEIVLLDPAGRELVRRRVTTPRHDYEATIRTVAGLVGAVEAEQNCRASVGVGIPGTLSTVTGRVKNANSVCLNGHPLDIDLRAALGRPIRLANDANCLARSEAADGAGAGCRTVFAAILGTGVGAGICIDSQILTGCNGIAGEWGHNPLPAPDREERPGPPCYCGRRGCIETFLSGPGLARDYRARLPTAMRDEDGPPLDAAEIVALAEAGDPVAEACLQRYERRLAKALAAVINILDPDVVVLGGGMSRPARLYQNLPRLWAPHIFSDTIGTMVRPALHGDSSGVRGAAWLWPLEAVSEGTAGA